MLRVERVIEGLSLAKYLQMEQEMVKHVEEPVFFTWIVPPTVIYGRHQIREQEVNETYCREHGIAVVQRQSGGGCVYADGGNLMVSYINPSTHSQEVFEEFLRMLAEALNGLGYEAVTTAHNDVMISNRKVSGTACFTTSTGTVVHASMLYDVDMDKITTMRKIVSIVCLLCASLAMMAQSELKGIHPYHVEEPANVAQEHAHWSIIPYVGVNWFFGDFNSNEAQSTLSFPSLGLGAEYAFNPAWSLGVEYGFNPWKLKGNPSQLDVTGARLNADTLLIGNAHMVDLYLAADLINLIHPFAKKKPVALMLTLGAGGAMHKNSVYYDMSEKNTEGRSARGNTAAHPTLKSSMKNYDFNPFLKFGLNLEFNINRTLALGVRAAYNLFLSDMIDGRQFNPNTDGLMDVALNMRVKFNAVNKTHARNVPGRDFPDVRAITVAEAKDYIKDDVADHVETAFARGVEAAKVHDTLIIHHDTVIIYHDNITPEALAAVQQASATNAVAVAAEEQPAPAPRVYSRAAQNFYVYFDSFKADLNEAGLVTIQQVADLMAEDKSLYALIVAYCDNTGSTEINRDMGDKRANNVAEELREEYGIDAARLSTHNHGVIVGGRSKAAYGPNRRVAIMLMDKTSFDKRKAELEEAKKKIKPAIQ